MGRGPVPRGGAGLTWEQGQAIWRDGRERRAGWVTEVARVGEEQAFWKRGQLHLENLLVGFPPSCPQTFAHEVARPRGPAPLHPACFGASLQDEGSALHPPLQSHQP